jgi:hypothetical protein
VAALFEAAGLWSFSLLATAVGRGLAASSPPSTTTAGSCYIRAVPTKEALWILSLLKEAVQLRGMPHELMSDDGTLSMATPAGPLPGASRSCGSDPDHQSVPSLTGVAHPPERGDSQRRRARGEHRHGAWRR